MIKLIFIKCLFVTMVMLQLNALAQPNNYSAKVNTQIGNKGKGASKNESYLEAGYTFPGATYPMGMVQFTPTFFSPDKGFVANQMSGAGCDHMGNFPTMPLEGKLQSSPYDMMALNNKFTIQQSTAGYFSVKAGNIECRLTVTPRTGMAVYKYPAKAKEGTIVIGSGLNGTTITNASIKITSNKTCEGYADGGTFCGSAANYTVYFVAAFDSPALNNGTWKDKNLHIGIDTATGSFSGAWFTFDVAKNKKVHYKFAISYVSLENAKENLK
ncbi:MAG: glycoside hydrolase family 92 protein, partial [Bacteroidia bacterium]|nr:glycoside hydrolase family 92 protein [Bacteroidia bacterium]